MSTAAATTNGSAASAGDQAYEALLRLIETAELPAGAPFVEREQAARLGMSRTPFREALHRLALEGLVERVPKRGTFVSHLDAKDIEDNMAVREAIEVEMARRAIERRRGDVVGLDRLLEAQRQAIAAADHRAFLAADEEFHVAIVAAADNPRALEAVRRAWLHVNRARYLVPMSVTAMRQALRDHREIHAALRRGSTQQTQRAIRKHVEEPLHRLLSAHLAVYPAAFSPPASQSRPR